jgi:hypothetical protein
MLEIKHSKALMVVLEEHTELEIFKIKVFCNCCSKILQYTIKEGCKTLKRHLKTLLYQSNLQRKTRQSHLNGFLEATGIEKFEKELLLAFTSANIKLYKLEY